jgi:GAF domain-containing protein
MLSRFLNILTPPSVTDPTLNEQIRVTRVLGMFFFIFGGSILLFGALNIQPIQSTVYGLGIYMLIFNTAILATSYLQLWRLSALINSIFLLGFGMFSALTALYGGFSLAIALPLLYMLLVYGWRGLLLCTILMWSSVITGALLVNRVPLPGFSANTAFTASPVNTLLTNITLINALGLMLLAMLGEQGRLRSYSNRLFAQLRTTAEIAQNTSNINELDELLRRTVDYIRDRFGYYHVQVFLLDDERRYAHLSASTGEVGQELLNRGHRLAVGSQSIIGKTTLTGKATLADNTEEDFIHRVNDLLPDTRSELALPLIAADQVIGALDVQSKRSNAFTQEDIDALQIMATQISIAIRNAQLFEEQKRSLNENRRLFIEAEANLREIQRLNQRLTGGAWEQHLQERRTQTIGVTLEQNDLRLEREWSSALKSAVERRVPVVTTLENRHIVAVPVELRGEILGAIEVEVAESLRQADLLELVQAVSDRLALSVDNARLFEDAQDSASQELRINAIATKMQGVGDVEELLQTVLREMGATLDATHGRLQVTVSPVQPSPTPNGHVNGKAV